MVIYVDICSIYYIYIYIYIYVYMFKCRDTYGEIGKRSRSMVKDGELWFFLKGFLERFDGFG